MARDIYQDTDAPEDPDAPGPGPTPSDEPAPARKTVFQDPIEDQPHALWERLVGLGVVLVATLAVFSILNPEDSWWPIWDIRVGWLFSNTTTNGGDMGAHVWWPKFLAENWFGKLRLSGWAPDWYSGFPAGHYYFPLPAVMVAIGDIFLPYNIAFKLVTVSGPLLLPAAAYSFARGIRAPWPAPPAFAVAAFGTLVQTRSGWQIYGGNISSTLAGEFSFTLALALGLFGLGALARTIDTGKRPWLPALLIAGAAMSHIVVAFFVALVAFLIWIVRKPWRTWRIAIPVGAIAIALTAVWSVPLLLRHNYTQSMRYGRLRPGGDFQLWSWLPIPGPIENTIEGFINSFSAAPDIGREAWLRLPWWTWLLSFVAIVAAGWYRRKSTLVLLVTAITVGLLFVQWPEHAVWNARWLPFWVLSWGFLAAMGATEIMRLIALGARSTFQWIRAGDLHDSRAVEWIRLARDENGEVDPKLRGEAVEVVAMRQFDRVPPGWEPPPGLQDRWIVSRVELLTRVTLAVLVVLAGGFGVKRAYDARDDNPGVAIEGWARWNYSGYERKPLPPPGQDTAPFPVSDEYFAIMNTMGALPCGRALWEPSSREDDPINTYGTSLALELLPHFTDGCIGSQEGLYFESSGTTSYHFITVTKVANHPSNPVRGLEYGAPLDKFDEGIEEMRQLGVRYYMAWSDEAQAKADVNRNLDLVAEVPDLDTYEPTGWKVYEIEDWGLVEGLEYEPVVAKTRAGSQAECFDITWQDPNNAPPELGSWECGAANWWWRAELLNTPWAQNGPDEWERIEIDELADAPRTRLDPVRVTDVVEDPDKISFTVDEVGVPVVVRASYFPNWNAHGADGPYRLAPNMMVVIPTENEVSLTYDLTSVDWLGRFITVLGIAGLVALCLWNGRKRYAAEAPEDDEDVDVDDVEIDHRAEDITPDPSEVQCPSCGSALGAGPYCRECGEKRPEPVPD